MKTSHKNNQAGFHLVAVVIFMAVIGVIGFVGWKVINKQSTENTADHQAQEQQGNWFAGSTNPVERGKALSAGACTGEGSKKLSSAPMRPSELSIIVPYGLMVGGHVTPIDHQYWWGKVQFGRPDMYDVLSPSDGRIVQVAYRDRQNSSINGVKGDYRVVISYSCTFFSYFDLATSLSDDIQEQLPADWEHGSNAVLNANIKVKAGQVVGKVGGQGLDYAVWDTTKISKGFVVREAYDVAEPWKVVTVSPLNYYTDSVKKQVLPLYARTAEPRDGTIGQDIDGTLRGNWFVEGTYGYAGSDQFIGGNYAKGHLALAHDLYDDSLQIFSIGEDTSQGGSQFMVKNPSVTFDKATASNGLVKYELAQIAYIDQNGRTWNGEAPAKKIIPRPGNTKGTALVQMLEKRKIKVQVFYGKTPSQVSGFTSAAKIYTRGEDAKNASFYTNPGAPTSTAQ